MTQETEKKIKNKNIIVCADGTGNKGGTTPDSNVYKIYKAINKRFKGETSDGFACDEQVVFYDNGVGTEKNNYLRALGGGFGFGFEDNVRDLYKYLARNYNPGDRIYFFGFSRGASTVRACNGFIRKCGLAKGKGKQNHQLDELVTKAFSAYQLRKKQPDVAEAVRTSEQFHAVVPIHFMGVWDTVVALGFPTGTDVTGTASKVFNKFSEWAGNRLDRKWWQHKFYFYKLTGNVVNAYQALAIDDERTAFWPFVWNEKLPQVELDLLKKEDGSPIERTVEQVWFAGMHSNVGGGYARSGMASVPLYWMMKRAAKCGLQFEDGAIEDAQHDSHVHGNMYDSRNGVAMMYRYHPREIEKLCKPEKDGKVIKKLKGEIKIHRSVIERINHRTANYAPGQLPGCYSAFKIDPLEG
ncbi:hypothetical protein MMIC_P2248 [Mariprofundus micogutta]|uniref:T6SS Phospholipase effector Tle1-like catalytic domain-containing protein n=1 Tax=Mariprofundus micogutta TaxID=1921010 RepID=A0A1L8CQQ6_9PROT|nr:DUF2235 domain-containing protein [Mariprofundus micogutta]GAV21266.1 hypothetical protein MMIC_P2248 [Mariprofundus micogutta]